MFTHMFVHEQVMKTIWLKAFLLHSQKQRLGLESHELLDCGGFSSLCKGNYWWWSFDWLDRSEAEETVSLATL